MNEPIYPSGIGAFRGFWDWKGGYVHLGVYIGLDVSLLAEK